MARKLEKSGVAINCMKSSLIKPKGKWLSGQSAWKNLQNLIRVRAQPGSESLRSRVKTKGSAPSEVRTHYLAISNSRARWGIVLI